MADAVKEATNIDFRTITLEEAMSLAKEHEIKVEKLRISRTYP